MAFFLPLLMHRGCASDGTDVVLQQLTWCMRLQLTNSESKVPVSGSALPADIFSLCPAFHHTQAQTVYHLFLRSVLRAKKASGNILTISLVYFWCWSFVMTLQLFNWKKKVSGVIESNLRGALNYAFRQLLQVGIFCLPAQRCSILVLP